MNRNFDKFEVGHWYVYSGTERVSIWNGCGLMDFVLDHKARKCLKTNSWTAAFSESSGESWSWGEETIDNWIEVEDPNKTHNIVMGEYFYRRLDNKIEVLLIHNTKFIANTGYYKLSRPPFKETKKEGVKVEEKKEFVPKKVKLSPHDDIWIDCARPEELPCECYVWDKIDHTLIDLTEGHIESAKGISNEGHYITICRCNFAVPVTRAKEALKFVSSVKMSDLKEGVKVKIKYDAGFMDRNEVAYFKKGEIYTVESTDSDGWGIWNNGLPFNVMGGVSFKEIEYSRFPIHWIEKIVDEKEERDFDINTHKSSSKIKISDLKNMFGVAIKVNSNEDRIKLMTAVGRRWKSGNDIAYDTSTGYPAYMIHDRTGFSKSIALCSINKEILWEDIDFEEYSDSAGAMVCVSDSNGRISNIKVGTMVDYSFFMNENKPKRKYIKLNKKPIKKVKEYKVHKREYIPLNK